MLKLSFLFLGSNEYPITAAPNSFNHRDNQEPLKPVCPVIKILFP